MKEQNRKYNYTTEITFSLGIGFTSRQTETQTVGEWLEIDESDMETLDDDDVSSELESLFDSWKWNHIDAGWYAA